jgi:large subunit ribosomal protein L17
MRHKLKGRKLNRTSSHRKALLINLTSALLKHELIKTTLPKAKELRPFVEKIMTIAKTDNLSNRRRVLSVVKDKELVAKLFSDIATRIKARNGGYTRIMHYGFRVGDKAPMAVIELVDRVIEPDDSKGANDSTKKSAKGKVAKKETVVKSDVAKKAAAKDLSKPKKTTKKEVVSKESDTKK